MKNMFEAYEQSEMIKKMQSLMNEISERFEYFNELYKDFYHEKITKDDMLTKIREKLSSFTDIELEEYNEMCKMFSKSNCEWSQYSVGEILHKEIINIWYPERRDV